jgi:isopenicillin N synthase-like dioxygenase
MNASGLHTNHDGIPILDLESFTKGCRASRETFVDDLRNAAHDVGFFYLRGYNESAVQSTDVLRVARLFFDLSVSQKQAIHMSNSPHFRGYTAAGDEITRGERDWREQLDVGAERQPLGEIDTLQPAWARMQGPNQWPAELPSLKPVLLEWQESLTRAAQQLLKALALALGQDANHFESAFAVAPVQHIKIINYPVRNYNE